MTHSYHIVLFYVLLYFFPNAPTFILILENPGNIVCCVLLFWVNVIPASCLYLLVNEGENVIIKGGYQSHIYSDNIALQSGRRVMFHYNDE